jgi:hypothetical protein
MFRRSGGRFADKNMRKGVACDRFVGTLVCATAPTRGKSRVFAILFTISLPFAAPC